MMAGGLLFAQVARKMSSVSMQRLSSDLRLMVRFLPLPWICLKPLMLNSLLDLAFRVAGLVYDETGGDPATRPKEFV